MSFLWNLQSTKCLCKFFTKNLITFKMELSCEALQFYPLFIEEEEKDQKTVLGLENLCWKNAERRLLIYCNF